MQIRVFALVFALAVGSTACGSDDPAATADTTTTTADPTAVDLSEVEWVDRTDRADVLIQARDNTFVPAYVIVKAGTPITFRNIGRTEHNALPVDEISFVGIEAAQLGPKGEVTVTFDEPGDFPYYCSLHGTTTKGMVGAIRVVA